MVEIRAALFAAGERATAVIIDDDITDEEENIIRLGVFRRGGIMQYLICNDYDKFQNTTQDTTMGNALILAYCFSMEWDSEVQIYEVHTCNGKNKLRYICNVDAS